MTSKSSLLIATFLLAAKWGSAAKCSDVGDTANFCSAVSGSDFVTGTDLNAACCEDICGTCRKPETNTEKSPCCTMGSDEETAKVAAVTTEIDNIFTATIITVDGNPVDVLLDTDIEDLISEEITEDTATEKVVSYTADNNKVYKDVFLKKEEQKKAFVFRMNQDTKTKAATEKIRAQFAKKDAPLRLQEIKKAAARGAATRETKRAAAEASCATTDSECKTAFSKKTAVIETKVELVADDLPPAILERVQAAAKPIDMIVALPTVIGGVVTPDTCSGTDGAGTEDCCTYDIESDTTRLAMLTVGEDLGSWGVLCEGDQILAKMTQIAAADTYSIACYDDASKDWGTAEDKTTGSVKNCNGKDILIGSITATDPPPTNTGGSYGVPVECLDPSVQVHVLNGLSVVATTVDKLKVGDVVVGEGRTSAIQNIERWKVDVETCVVPFDLCAAPATLRHKNNVRILHKHKHPEIIVSENHAVRCPSWPANVWTFCDDDWERRRSSELVHVELESYVEDHLMSGNVVLESWDGYTRVETDIDDVCEHGGCPWSHEWMELPSQADEVVKYVRKDLRLSTFKSGKKWKIINAEKMEQCMLGWLSLSASD